MLGGSVVALLPVVAAFLAQANEASAQTFVWTGAANNNWNNNGNWSPSNPGSGGIDVIVDASTVDLTAARTFNLNNGTTTLDRTVGTLRFGDTNAANTTTYNWTVGANAGGTATPSLILAVSTGQGTIQVVNGTTTFNPILAGTSGLAKTGGGTLVLTNGANTITGGISLNAGTLSFSSGALGANLVTSTGNAALTWNGHLDDVSNKIVLGDGFTFTLNVSNVPGENITFANALQTGPLGTASVTKGNAGDLTLTTENTWTGGTRVNNGRLILVGGDNRLSTLGSLTFGNGANSGILQLGDASRASNQTVTGLVISGTGTTNAVVGAHTTNSIFTVNNSTNSTFNGVFGGAGTNENNLALVKTGAGTLTLGGNSTFSGDVTIGGGRLVLTNGTALGAGPKTIHIQAATDAPSLQLNGASGPISLPSSLSLVTSNDDAVSPAIVNTAGNNVISGSISPTTGGAGTGNTRILVSGGTLGLTGNISPAIATPGSLDLILDGAGNGIASGVIANNGSRTLGLIKEGLGAWTLSAGNTYTGATFINGGRLNLTTAQSGGGAITLADGTTLGVTVAGPGQSLNTTGLTLSSGTTIAVDLGSSSNPTAAIIAGGGFATPAIGLTTLNVAATGLSVGQFPLISYSGAIGGGGTGSLALGLLPARVTANLAFATGEVRLNVSAFEIPKWTGGTDGSWDIDPDGTGTLGTKNWTEATSGNLTRYLQGTGGTDSVLFDDTPGVPTNVLLTTTLTPTGVTVNSSANAFAFSGAGKLSGAASLLKQGTSTLTLLNTGGNDFTGTTTLAGGTIQIGDGATVGAGQLGTGIVVNNASLVFNRPDDLTASSAISGSGTIQKQGPGVLTLSGNNSAYDGGITISAGTVKVASGSALGSALGTTIVAASGSIDITGFAVSEPILLNGGTLKSLTGTAGIASGVVTINGGGVLDSAAGTLTVSASVSGSGGLAKNGAGTVLLAAANGFAGGLTVNQGTVILNAANTYTGGTVIQGGILQIGASSTATTGAPGLGDIALNPASGTATLNILRGDTALNITNNITSSGVGTNSVTIGATGATSSSGTVTFSGNNTFTGNVVINGGALRITNGNALGVGPKTVSIGSNAGPSLRIDGSAGDITLAPEISFTASSDGTIDNVAANSGAIVNVAGNNTILGNIALINGGGGQGRIQSESGNLLLAGNIDSTGATGGRTLLIGGAGNGTASGIIANGAFVVNVTKDGAGTWTITGQNTFTGTVNVQAGKLRINAIDETPSNVQALGTGTGAVTLGTATSHGILEYTGSTAAILSRAVTVNGVGGGTLLNSSGALLTLGGTVTTSGRPLTLTGGSFDVTGSIVGTAANSSVTVSAAQVLLSSSFNGYNGPTHVHHGSTVTLAAGNGLPVGTTLVLGEPTDNTGGTFDLHGNDQSVTSLDDAGTGAHIITNGALNGLATLTVTGPGSFGGILEDGSDAQLAFTKGGTGEFSLDGANTYGGATNVNGGTLLITGSLSGTSGVLVDNGGTLGGSGVIATDNGGILVVAAGGGLAPGGAGAGVLTVALGAGQFDLSAATSGVGYLHFDLGTASDQINLVSGILNLGSGFDLEDFAFTQGSGFGPGTYVLFNSAAGILGNLGPVTTGTLFEHEFTLGFSGGSSGNEDLVLTVAVPEPGSALILLAGLGVLAARRRRGSIRR